MLLVEIAPPDWDVVVDLVYGHADNFMGRAIYADPAQRRQRSVASAVAASLVAPGQVLRQPLVAGTCPAGSFSEDTLVLLRLERANARHPGYRTAFMSESWSWCPAQDWLPALLEAVWREAIGRETK